MNKLFRRSLDTDYAAALVHALIAFRVDYCNAVLAGRQGPSPTRFNGCSRRQLEWSVEPGSLIAA